ncbi:hypothetical protein EJB05_36008, partial [Eragrostis curvula]
LCAWSRALAATQPPVRGCPRTFDRSTVKHSNLYKEPHKVLSRDHHPSILSKLHGLPPGSCSFPASLSPPPMTSAPASFGALANSGPVALSFGSSFLGGGSRLKTMAPSSLPLSPSSCFNAASGFLESPILLTPSLFPSPTTGAFPSEPFNWMGTTENLQDSVKEEQQRQGFDFTFQPAVSVQPATMAGATQAESFPQSSMLMAPLGGLGDSSYNNEPQPWSYQQEQAAMDFNAPPFEAPSSVAATQPADHLHGGYGAAAPAGFREQQTSRRTSDDGAANDEHSFGAQLSGTPVATPENSSAGSFADDDINGAASYNQGGVVMRPAPVQAAADQSGAGFALSGFGDTMASSYAYASHEQQQQSDGMYSYASRTKDEPSDDMAFFEQPFLF